MKLSLIIYLDKIFHLAKTWGEIHRVSENAKKNIKKKIFYISSDEVKKQ